MCVDFTQVRDLNICGYRYPRGVLESIPLQILRNDYISYLRTLEVRKALRLNGNEVLNACNGHIWRETAWSLSGAPEIIQHRNCYNLSIQIICHCPIKLN